jgi:hypothetical protein
MILGTSSDEAKDVCYSCYFSNSTQIDMIYYRNESNGEQKLEALT